MLSVGHTYEIVGPGHGWSAQCVQTSHPTTASVTDDCPNGTKDQSDGPALVKWKAGILKAKTRKQATPVCGRNSDAVHNSRN